MGTVKFAEPIVVPGGPKIIAAGTAAFSSRPDTSVTFEAEIPLPYFVLITGDAGYQARRIDAFAVVNKTSSGFGIKAGDGNSRASVDWLVVK